jgi:HEPN domain-containing protein
VIRNLPTPPELAAGLIRPARADLRHCRLAAGDDDLRPGAAFHLQQAWEKGVKAALARLRIRHERTHDLAELATLLPAAHGDPLPGRADLATLTRYAVATRYEPEEPVETAARLPAWADACEGMLAAVEGRLPPSRGGGEGGG